MAVDAHTGEPVVFGQHSGVDLVAAVAASCANGFGVPPYGIGGRRYIDGGYRANENADLAAGYGRAAFGRNLMDLSARPPAARAGYHQGRAVAGGNSGRSG